MKLNFNNLQQGLSDDFIYLLAKFFAETRSIGCPSVKFKTGFLERKKAQILSNSTCSADLSCTDKTTKTRNKQVPQVGLSLDKKL